MSIKHSDANTSPAESGPQLSPFSATFSILSEVTTDEPPDLGAFTTVFRELATFQPPPPLPTRNTTFPIASNPEYGNPESTDSDSDAALSTVWNHDPIQSYFEDHTGTDTRPGIEASDERASLTEGEEDRVIHGSGPGPSLGVLDSALFFLASERAKLTNPTQRDVSNSDHQVDHQALKAPWQTIIGPRRRRRRRRKPPKPEVAGTVTIAPTPDSSVEFSSSPDSGQQPPNKPGIMRFAFSRSTPNLLTQTTSPDPAFEKLRELAHKLSSDFPENSRLLSKLPKMTVNPSSEELFVDPRCTILPRPNATPPLINVFIDHSNILIGFLSYIRRNPALRRKATKFHLSHAALTLILERGRMVTKRVMAASSPLYQPMDTAEQLGYDVNIFARVPQPAGSGGERNTSRSRGKGHSSQGSNEADSAGQQRATRRNSHGRNSSGSGFLSSISLNHSPHIGGSNQRIRLREQGVDELLQLKLHQSIIDIEHPPLGSTIVLATGDGNTGEFNDDGFVGCVRSALKKGWNVELYAWQECLSRVWEKEFAESEWKDKFKIIGLEKYGADLLLI